METQSLCIQGAISRLWRGKTTVGYPHLGGDTVPVHPGGHIQVVEGEDHLGADLAAEGEVVPEPLQVNAQRVWQLNDLKQLKGH